MRTPIVHGFDPITRVGAGDLGPGDLELALERAPTLVAADGGAAAALRVGHDPVAVIGDFDSLPADVRARIAPDRLFAVREQDTTDFDKALRSIDAPLILAVGFLGGRVDHQLAAFNTLVRHADRRCILIGSHEVIFHAPPQIELALSEGDVVSLFALAPVRGWSRGLEWPIDGLEMAPAKRMSISNRALGPVRLKTDGHGVLVIVPRGALDVVMQAIARSCSDQDRFDPAPRGSG